MNFLAFDGKKKGEPSHEESLPKTADDLKFPSIPLEVRTKALEKIAQARNQLKSIEIKIIMSSSDGNNDKKGLSDKDKKKLDVLIAKICESKILIKCELEECNNRVECFYNLCKEHLGINIDKKSLVYYLIAIRNIVLRLSFLEEQISLSLSNQLEERDLKSALNEVDKLTFLF